MPFPIFAKLLLRTMPEAIEIKDFSYYYPDGTAALREINLNIQQGQKVVLIGPNGAGKSTLLLAMAGFIKGTGKVYIDSVEINKKNLKKIRSSIGSCLEDPDDQLFMPTLFDDVAFGPLNMGLSPEDVKSSVSQALKTVGLSEMADKAPHHLSAGQKRAAAIATILAMNPKIITFDEPDGSLDPRHRTNLLTLLNGLSQTLVIATCNMDFASRIADRAILIDDGRIITDGPANKIMLDSNLMAKHGLEVPTNKSQK
jgi:cobalt/nickel transport system ATP-binding protein